MEGDTASAHPEALPPRKGGGCQGEGRRGKGGGGGAVWCNPSPCPPTRHQEGKGAKLEAGKPREWGLKWVVIGGGWGGSDGYADEE